MRAPLSLDEASQIPGPARVAQRAPRLFTDVGAQPAPRLITTQRSK
jgi:hypothetical protein